MKKNSSKLSDNLKNEAMNNVNEIKNPKSKIRAYASLLGINILAKYLDNNDAVVDKANCCSDNQLILGEFDVADIKANGKKLDVRVVVGDEFSQMLIPRNHLIYGLTPFVYVAVKIDSNINNAELIGFIESEAVDSSQGNKNFVIVENSALRPINELMKALNESNTKPKSFLAKDHERAKEMFVSYLDNEISNADKEYLIRHLANCDECRNDFNILHKLNKIFIQTSNCKEIAEMFSETIINQEIPANKAENNSSLNNVITAGAAIAATAAAGAVVAASGTVVANAVTGAVINNVVGEVSQSKGLFGKIKGVFSKKSKDKVSVPEKSIAEMSKTSVETKEISDFDELNQQEIISNIQDILENSTTQENDAISEEMQESESIEELQNISIQEDIPEEIEEIENVEELSNIVNLDNISEEIQDTNELQNASIKDDIQNFVQEISDNVLANIDEVVVEEIFEQEFEIVEDTENFTEEVISEIDFSNNFDNSELAFEIIEESEDFEDINMDISINDNEFLDSLQEEVGDFGEFENTSITPESSYFSNFVKPESIEINYNAQKDIEPYQQTFAPDDSTVEIAEDTVDKSVEIVNDQSEENINNLLRDIDKVEIVGSLETIDVGSDGIDGSLDIQSGTVIKLNITKKEVNPLKIAAAVVLATSISLSGYAYWKYTFLLTDVKPDSSMFKTQETNVVAQLPPNNNIQNDKPVPAKPPVKKAEPPKPYVKKAETANQNNLNDDLARALVSQGGPVKISNISWEVGASLASNPIFKNYLMVTGQALKSALSTDLTLANERVINDQIRILIILDTQGNIQDTQIKMGSGSNQVDKLVLQTLKNTLNYTKLPLIQTNKKQIKVGLIVNL
jgi:hypothetical protein